MIRKLSLAILLSFYFSLLSSQPQIRVRLYTGQNPYFIFFKVKSGQYIIDCHNGKPISLKEGEVAVISRYKNRIGVKSGENAGFEADSLLVKGSGPDASFLLRTGRGTPAWRAYSGTLECFPDLGSLVAINTVDIEKYLAGVVKAEGGSGKNVEYFKTQAVIARTYTWKYLDKHKADKYNLCDDTHCQAFNGLTTDSLIIASVLETQNQVIAAPDSSLIISAFHSNCGGETSPSEYAWLTSASYLIKIIDPYCVTSTNASWKIKLSLKEWYAMLTRHGYNGPVEPADTFAFIQRSRVQDYVSGSFKIPFRTIREDLKLRSSWFSVTADGDSISLTGKGYGHGVGLCQEGAMVMAASGKRYEEIIMYYYPGVQLMYIGNINKMR